MVALEGLAGNICIVDGILVFSDGKDFIEAEHDHNRRFVMLMEHCLKENIKLNQAAKLQFKVLEIYGQYHHKTRNESRLSRTEKQSRPTMVP